LNSENKFLYVALHVDLLQQASERREIHTKFWWRNLKEKEHLESLGDVDRSVTLNLKATRDWDSFRIGSCGGLT
jgi:hypothetical protein